MSTEEPDDFSILIPELSAWNNGKGISVKGWLNYAGSFPLAIAFSRLFWPEFVEHDGCILFKGFSAESYLGFMKQTRGDRGAVETVMNHKHIADLFTTRGEVATREQIVYLGRLLKDIWQTKLADFPSRQFVVSFEGDEGDELVDYEITFWQTANRLGV